MKKFTDIYEKKVNVIQRKKQARRMAKLAKSPTFQKKKQRALLRMRNADKLAQVARKKTIQMYRDKFYPQYKSMGVQQRVVVDQKIMQKYGAKIDKISRKLTMKLRKKEVERVKQARASFRKKDS